MKNIKKIPLLSNQNLPKNRKNYENFAVFYAISSEIDHFFIG